MTLYLFPLLHWSNNREFLNAVLHIHFGKVNLHLSMKTYKIMAHSRVTKVAVLKGLTYKTLKEASARCMQFYGNGKIEAV